jgi:hypothetical protein
MLHTHETWGNVMSPESLLKLVPCDLSILGQCGSVMTPPNARRSLQLMRCKFNFHLLGYPQQAEFLFQRVQPFISLKWLFSLFEDWWLCVQEILKVTVLVRLCPLMLIQP